MSLGPRQRPLLGVAVALVGPAALTAATRPIADTLTLAGVTLLYLVPVVAAAVVGGVRPALLAAVGAALLVNFYFLTPYHSLDVDSPAGVVVPAFQVERIPAPLSPPGAATSTTAP